MLIYLKQLEIQDRKLLNCKLNLQFEHHNLYLIQFKIAFLVQLLGNLELFLIQHMSQLAYMHVFVCFSLSLTVLSTEREICLFQAERELGFYNIVRRKKKVEWQYSDQDEQEASSTRAYSAFLWGCLSIWAYIWQLKEPTFVCCYGLKSPNCFCLL